MRNTQHVAHLGKAGLCGGKRREGQKVEGGHGGGSFYQIRDKAVMRGSKEKELMTIAAEMRVTLPGSPNSCNWMMQLRRMRWRAYCMHFLPMTFGSSAPAGTGRCSGQIVRTNGVLDMLRDTRLLFLIRNNKLCPDFGRDEETSKFSTAFANGWD
jgi:hypothetical protein